MHILLHEKYIQNTWKIFAHQSHAKYMKILAHQSLAKYTNTRIHESYFSLINSENILVDYYILYPSF